MAVVISAFQVTVAAVKLSSVGSHVSLLAYNNGPNIVWVGTDNTVSSSNGFPIPANGGVLRLDHASLANQDIWATCSVLQASPADTRLLVET